MVKNLETTEENQSERQKVTISLDVDLVETIDDYIHHKRKTLPMNEKRKLNRTNLIRVALKLIMENHSSRCENSALEKFIFDRIIYETQFENIDE